MDKESDDHISSWSIFLDLEKEEHEKRTRSNNNAPIVGAADFFFIRTIGKGAYGKVFLVQNINTKKSYACKVMRKKHLVMTKQVSSAYNEKVVLSSIRCPFTVHLNYFFQDTTFLYYVMYLVEGAELFAYLREEKKFPERMSRFFAAQVILALEYLHYLDLIYRDIKPENILLDRTGYIRITDFGFCKKVPGRTYTVCGTPEYIAPEILIPKGYGKEVDWWSFGVLLYELNCGYTPFYARSDEKVFEKIVKGKYNTPKYLSKDLKDIIEHLLEVDISKRYGFLLNGVRDIKEHKWFQPVIWIELVNKTLKPPYEPKIPPPEVYVEKPFVLLSHDSFEEQFADF